MLTAPIKIPPVHVRNLSTQLQANGQPKIKFVNPNSGNFDRNIRYAAETGYKMIQEEALLGKTVVVAGSGPSLTDPDVLNDIRKAQKNGAVLMALKKAIKVLHERGFKIDYACSMDPGAHIACEERIYKAPGVHHILATSSDPKLFEYLDGETISLFHSACGLPNEVQLYQTLFADKSGIKADAWVAGGGYNVTNRAVAACMFMGAAGVIIAGADSGWREGASFYADGTNNRPGVDMSDNGAVELSPEQRNRLASFAAVKSEGKQLDEKDEKEFSELSKHIWHTRPDMLASGVALARLQKKFGRERVVFLGNVMPAILATKEDSFLDNCVAFQK